LRSHVLLDGPYGITAEISEPAVAQGEKIFGLRLKFGGRIIKIGYGRLRLRLLPSSRPLPRSRL
jgi:hypothetical protein